MIVVHIPSGRKRLGRPVALGAPSLATILPAPPAKAPPKPPQPVLGPVPPSAWERALSAICQAFETTPELIYAENNRPYAVQPRFALASLLRTFAMSYPAIARNMRAGNFNHSSAWYHVRRHQQMYQKRKHSDYTAKYDFAAALLKETQG